MIPETQSDVAAFLEARAGRPPIETHISAVFVGPETAWKLKKAVALPFLDFTKPARRRHFVEHEFALNHSMAPGLYRAVRGIARAADGLHFCPADSPGATEWVLEMEAIPPADFLDEIAAQGGLTPDLCRSLGDLVARLHEAAPIARQNNAVAHMQKLVGDIMASAPRAGLAQPSLTLWHTGMQAQLQAHGALLTARAGTGRVRRVHGDLHLGNLCLWHGSPLPFDALEFDEELATIDTGYDLAFLLMDIEQHAGRNAANAVFNRYMARTGDWGLLPLLPLFLSLRAMVRAYVGALQNKPGGGAYLQAALAYLQPAPTPVIAIGGLQGTGKSTLARALAPGLGPAPGALVLRSDELRKRQHHAPPETRLPQAAYSPEANAALNAALLQAAAEAAPSGHGLIIDASFITAPLRAEMEQTIRATSRAWLGLWLEAPLPVLTDRLEKRRGDASDAGPEVLRQAAPAETGPINWHRLNAEEHDTLYNAALALCGQPQT